MPDEFFQNLLKVWIQHSGFPQQPLFTEFSRTKQKMITEILWANVTNDLYS